MATFEVDGWSGDSNVTLANGQWTVRGGGVCPYASNSAGGLVSASAWAGAGAGVNCNNNNQWAPGGRVVQRKKDVGWIFQPCVTKVKIHGSEMAKKILLRDKSFLPLSANKNNKRLCWLVGCEYQYPSRKEVGSAATCRAAPRELKRRKMKKAVTKDMVEDLGLYKHMLFLLRYTLKIVKKFPKVEKPDLVAEIKKETFDGMRLVIKIGLFDEKYHGLNELDLKCKYLKALARVAFEEKYITGKNLENWLLRLTEVNNVAVGWRKKWAKQ
jgi:hypothetical protein